ncbi:MAG: SGNH/GDSL hydrolase family protein [Bacteroidaceae bacterium]|nr:SGNH/GDSL hydrolase family protein [Bacteroidaceae bacterium]
MSKSIKKMAVRYKPLLEEHDATCKCESSLDKIFSPGCYAVEIDHIGADVGLPVDDCKEEHYIVGSLVVTDCGTIGPKQRNRVMGQALTFTSRSEKTTKVYTRTFADGEWGAWRSLAETGVFKNITSPEELVYTVEELVNISNNQNTRIEDIEKSDVVNAALDSFIIVGEVTDEQLTYHSYFKNVNVEVTDEQKSAKYDLSSIALCLLRKGNTEGQAEIRWSAMNREKNLREYVLGYNICIPLSTANGYGYTHVEQENSEAGLKISYDIDLNAPLPKSQLIYGSSGATATMLLQQDRVTMSAEGVVKSYLPIYNTINQHFVGNKGYYIKLTADVLSGVSKAPVNATTDDDATYTMIDVVEREIFVISAMGTTDIASWAVIGKDGYVIKGYSSGVGENAIKEHTVVMPADASKLVVNSWSTAYCSLKQMVSPVNDIPFLYKKMNSNNALINSEATRATATEQELLARIQGTSENSNAMRDPFKSLGIIDTIEEMLSLLDGLCSDVAGTNDYGKFRINLNGVNVYVTNYVLGRDYQVFAQEIYAPIEIKNVVGEEKCYLTADESAASYVHITRKYAQELQMVTNYRETGNSRTLRRTHHKSYGWSNWVDTSNPYIASPLYGKNILLLGGSFAHNMRAFAGGLGFTIDKKDYSMQNYIAEQLGLSHFDNFAIQGEGCCTTEGVFLKRNTLEQFRLAAQKATENGYSYDAIILVGGLNDFQKSVPVGKLSDATTAGTFCAGLKALANEIRATYSTAKILFTTPFRCTNSTDWGDAFWNPLSKKTNSAGCRFAEYIQAIKEVAHLRSIPLLDIYSICQIDTHNAGKLLLSDLVHPNGQGYLTIAPALLDFIAWQKGAAGFSNDALQMNLKSELQNIITVEQERAQTAESAAIEKGRKLALRDLFVAAGALYNDTTATIMRTAPWGESVQHLAGHYYLNGLGDVTEEQMMKIYTRKEALRNMKGRSCQLLASMRTYIPIAYNTNAIQYVYDATSPLYLFGGNTALEILLWSAVKPFSLNPTYEHAVPVVGDCKAMFSGCTALKIIGALTLSGATSVANMFQGCSALEYVFLRGIKMSISLSDSPNVAKESVLYSIVNATPTTAITLTLHADAYARLAEDTDIVTALEAQPLVTLVSA